eukprot:5378431-Karenia_brevis.AAC.1
MRLAIQEVSGRTLTPAAQLVIQLPISQGGLGLRSMSQIAPAAYIASWALSVSRVLQVPGIHQDLLQLGGVCGTQFQRALSFWDHARHLRGLA